MQHIGVSLACLQLYHTQWHVSESLFGQTAACSLCAADDILV